MRKSTIVLVLSEPTPLFRGVGTGKYPTYGEGPISNRITGDVPTIKGDIPLKRVLGVVAVIGPPWNHPYIFVQIKQGVTVESSHQEKVHLNSAWVPLVKFNPGPAYIRLRRKYRAIPVIPPRKGSGEEKALLEQLSENERERRDFSRVLPKTIPLPDITEWPVEWYEDEKTTTLLKTLAQKRRHEAQVLPRGRQTPATGEQNWTDLLKSVGLTPTTHKGYPR